MSITCSDVCELIDQKLRKLGFDYPDDEDHEPLIAALEQCVLRRENDAVLYAVTESELAIAWAEARCPDCQLGVCEKDGSAHDLAAYHGQSAEQRREVRERVAMALLDSSVTEAVHDVLAAVAERQ